MSCFCVGSLSTLKQEGSLYEEGGSSENEIWKGQTEELVTEPHEKNKFITDLEDIDKGDINVSYLYIYVYVYTRTLVILCYSCVSIIKPAFYSVVSMCNSCA